MDGTWADRRLPNVMSLLVWSKKVQSQVYRVYSGEKLFIKDWRKIMDVYNLRSRFSKRRQKEDKKI